MPQKKLNTLPNNIREFRVRQRMTIIQLAEKTGLTHQYVSMLERGAKPLVDRTLILFAEALGVEKAQLIGKKLTPAVDPKPGDIVQDDFERMLLHFWRRLTPEGKHVAYTHITSWATGRLDTAATG